eukprot:1145668-Pelagomonas_calceolata.AAC.10
MQETMRRPVCTALAIQVEFPSQSCVELYMGDRGIEKIRGFEPYDNLQSLWLNNNRLKKINNLDANFRIKALYVQVGQGWAC